MSNFQSPRRGRKRGNLAYRQMMKSIGLIVPTRRKRHGLGFIIRNRYFKEHQMKIAKEFIWKFWSGEGAPFHYFADFSNEIPIEPYPAAGGELTQLVS